MELHALNSGRKPRVVTAMTMLKQYLFQCVFYISIVPSFIIGDPIIHPILPLYMCGVDIEGKLGLLSYLVVSTQQGHTFSLSHHMEALTNCRM